jgi:hypothetical protein
MSGSVKGVAGLDRHQMAHGDVAKKLHDGILPYTGIRGKWSQAAVGMD